MRGSFARRLDRSRELVKQINQELEINKVKSEELDLLIAKLKEEAPDSPLTEELQLSKSSREAASEAALRERELALKVQPA